jgi:hypothetical protein
MVIELNDTRLELGDLVRIQKDFRYTAPVSGSRHCSLGVGLVVNIQDKKTAKDQPQLAWQEYTILWSETGKQTKHFSGQLVKINGEQLWEE